MRTIKTVQWNIGGGKTRPPEADPLAFDLYTQDGLGYIIGFLHARNPDIITLNETHANGDYNQTQIIAETLGYDEGHWTNHSYADSHIKEGFRLGQGIISRFPIVGHTFDLFTYPNLTTMWKGKEIPTHDKGVTSASLYLGGGALLLTQTFHPIPFEGFQVELSSPTGMAILEDMATKILQTRGDPTLLQGDCNTDTASLQHYFPALFEAGFE